MVMIQVSQALNYDKEFLELSSQGLTKVQIAVRLGVLSRDLLSHLSPGIAEKGKELCQVFHENLLDQMIKSEVRSDTKEKDLQAWRLKTLFRADWADKKEDGDIGAFESLSDKELVFYIHELLGKNKELLEGIDEPNN